jgi:signal transduction histidine kinase
MQKEELVFSVIAIAVTLFILVGFVIFLVVLHFRSRIKKHIEILKAIYETQERERTRFGLELHDDIGAQLSLLKIQNEMLINQTDYSVVATYAAKNATTINKIVRDVRIIARNQASRFIKENGIEHELEVLRFKFTDDSSVKINSEINIGTKTLNKDFEVNLFRILQELVHNSIKHAFCTEINIKILLENNTLSVHYIDNGKGFDPAQTLTKGLGLENIRTRVNLFNGVCNFISAENGTEYHFLFDAEHAFESPIKPQKA